MSQNGAKKNGSAEPRDNYHVKFRPGQARWLREQVNEDEPYVPTVVKNIIDEAQRAGRQPKSHKKRKP